MRISLVVAMDRNGLIGNENGLPWRLPADLKRFRQLTIGKPIVMGRKTFDSIGRVLPDRTNIVVTRRRDFQFPGAEVVHSFAEALQRASASSAGEMMIIGGAEIFREALPVANRIYLTVVEGEFAGPTYFPVEMDSRWAVAHDERLPADAKNAFAQRFLILDRSQHGVSLASLLV